MIATGVRVTPVAFSFGKATAVATGRRMKQGAEAGEHLLH